MRNHAIPMFLLVALCLCGCACTVNPLVDNSNQVKDFDLSGYWLPSGADAPDEKSSAILVVSTKEEGRFQINFTGQKYDAVIGKVGKEQYLQISDTTSIAAKNHLLSSLPIYTFAKIEIEKDTISIYFVEMLAARRLHSQYQDKIFKYHRSKEKADYYISTHSTSELQTLIADHSKELFTGKPQVFTRVSKK